MRRALHTLKGNAAVLGLVALPMRCHELEDRLAERIDGAEVLDDDMRAIEEELARVIARVHELAGEGAFERVEIAASELAAAIATLERGGPPSEVLCLLRRWTLEPVARPLGKLARRAQGLAQTLGKNVEVVVVDRNVHLDAGAFEPLWGALAHAVNNAVDHGIEPEEVRTEGGKPARGRIVLSAEDCGDGWVVIEVNDDGGGIDLEAIRIAASRRGLPCSTRGELLEALFADEVSARTEVTSTSGRGVGLAALRATCADLDGAVDVDTEEGAGTRLRLRVPRLGRSFDRRAA